MARRRKDPSRLRELEALREERFELMERLAKLPKDTVFFTQITMEAAEDPAFLDAMRNARIRGALIGVEAVTEEGLKDVYKGFNLAGDALVNQLQQFREHGVHVLGSFIFGLPSDRPDSFEATAALAHAADIDFAQFLTLTPFPGTVDFLKWEKTEATELPDVDGVPVSRLLAHSPDQAAEDLLAPPGDDRRGDPRRNATRLGSLLFARQGLAPFALRPLVALPSGVHAGIEAVPPDVRQYRHSHRQRASLALGSLGALARHPAQAAVLGSTDAGAAGTGAVTGTRDGSGAGSAHAAATGQPARAA